MEHWRSRLTCTSSSAATQSVRDALSDSDLMQHHDQGVWYVRCNGIASNARSWMRSTGVQNLSMDASKSPRRACGQIEHRRRMRCEHFHAVASELAWYVVPERRYALWKWADRLLLEQTLGCVPAQCSSHLCSCSPPHRSRRAHPHSPLSVNLGDSRRRRAGIKVQSLGPGASTARRTGRIGAYTVDEFGQVGRG